MNPHNTVLEIIAATVDDALAAEAGGATRLEIVRALDQGGLTPSLDIVRAISAAVSLPLRVMVRESPTFSVASPDELDRLCNAARALGEMEVDGLVLGFLRDGEVDLATTRRVLGCAPRLKATFHRAFEAAASPARALRALRALPQIDHILASGGEGDALQRKKNLDQLARMAQPELRIIAGGLAAASDLAVLRQSPWLRDFHAGRTARAPEQPLAPVRAEKVRALLAQITA